MVRGVGLSALANGHLEDAASKDGKSELAKRCFEQDADDLKSLFHRAYHVSRNHFSNMIHFYVPSMVHYETLFYQAANYQKFPAISVTGKSCHLDCEHCKGKILESMIPATTPEELLKACIKIRNQGGTGCLISGGSLTNGSVPLMKFIPTIRRVKQDLGLQTVIHTGLVGASLAKALANIGIDAAMIDVIGSNDTLKEICHLDGDIGSFDRSLSLLEENSIPTVPHIIVGMHYGKLKGEKAALEMISRYNPAAVVVVALMPLSDTEMEHVSPPRPLDVARVVLASRLVMPKVPLLLGCARPRGQHKVRTDILAIKAGVNGVAYPSEEACEFAEKLGLSTKFHEKCCSLIWQDPSLGASSAIA